MDASPVPLIRCQPDLVEVQPLADPRHNGVGEEINSRIELVVVKAQLVAREHVLQLSPFWCVKRRIDNDHAWAMTSYMVNPDGVGDAERRGL